MKAPRGMLPLRHRAFRLLVAGQLASNLGDAFYAIALPWYVLASRGGALLLGTVLAAYGVPRVALLAVGGHLSDRWRPWSVMMIADAIRAVAVGALGIVALSGPASAALLVPVAAILGAGEGLFLPGSFSIVPRLLPDADLQAGNALTSGGTQLANLVGPALGGVLVGLAGPGTGFLVDAGSFLVSALSLVQLRSHARTAEKPDVVGLAVPATDAPLDHSMPAGGPPTLWGVLRSERVLQVILVVSVAANLGSGGLSEVALPALARGGFHVAAEGYGGLIAAFGGGALVGTLVAAQTPGSSRPAMLASAAFLLDAASIAVVPYLGGALLAGVALAVFGFMNGFGNVVTITAFQRWAPPALLGRLTGLLLVASFGIFPVSVLLSGVVVHTWGPGSFFPLAGATLALAVLAGITQSTWRHFGATREPQIAVSDGPTPARTGNRLLR